MFETEMISDEIVIVDVDIVEDNLQIYFVTLPDCWLRQVMNRCIEFWLYLKEFEALDFKNFFSKKFHQSPYACFHQIIRLTLTGGQTKSSNCNCCGSFNDVCLCGRCIDICWIMLLSELVQCHLHFNIWLWPLLLSLLLLPPYQCSVGNKTIIYCYLLFLFPSSSIYQKWLR